MLEGDAVVALEERLGEVPMPCKGLFREVYV